MVSTNYIFVHLLYNKVVKSSLMHGTNMKIVDKKLFKEQCCMTLIV